MKILFFSRLFYPHIGGVEKHVLEISRLLIKKGHKVCIITEKYENNLKSQEAIEGVDVYRIDIKNKSKKLSVWSWLFKNVNLIKDADVVHCHDVFFWYLPFRFLVPFKKVYTTFHGYESYPLKSKNILMHKIAEILSMGNICIGDFIKKWYGTKPTYMTYGGVNIATSDKRQATSENSAVFIGRLDEQTGIRTYVNAVKQIRKKIPDFKFAIIGDGKLKKEINKNFKVLGFQKNPEKYFSEYNFAFVSRYLSILEAMKARKLVFAVYDNPLKEDYLRLAPFSKYIIISNSPSQLTSKVHYHIDNPKKKEKIIEGAYSWVKKNTWYEMTNTYLKLWKKGFAR